MRRKNLDQCECDRCGKKELLSQDSPSRSDWHDLQRVTADGTVKPFLLCKGCFEKYRDLAAEQDRTFSLWLGMGV